MTECIAWIGDWYDFYGPNGLGRLLELLYNYLKVTKMVRIISPKISPDIRYLGRA